MHQHRLATGTVPVPTHATTPLMMIMITESLHFRLRFNRHINIVRLRSRMVSSLIIILLFAMVMVGVWLPIIIQSFLYELVNTVEILWVFPVTAVRTMMGGVTIK